MTATSTPHIELCVRCSKRSTFMSDRVCSECRNANKKPGGVDEVSR